MVNNEASCKMNTLPMTSRFFIGSNVWGYALLKLGDSRTATAQKFLREIAAATMPVIACQVVSETIRVLKKAGVCKADLRKFHRAFG
jgi:predicted nucleic acid-binding protein